MSSAEPEVSFVGDDDSAYFRTVFGRRLNAMSMVYLLPADNDEIKRYDLHHRLIQFLFSGRNYVGPVKEVMQFGQHRRVLDLGTGSGQWAIDIADEFPRAEVIGIDLAPVQPRRVPPNCTFELFDINQGIIPYPDGYFDLIHARSMHIGVLGYPHLIREIYRLLVPGGLVILIEPDLMPMAADTSPSPDSVEASGWFAIWDTYRRCLKKQGIDATVPRRLSEMLATRHFEKIFEREATIPVGFWPTDPDHLTVGQLQWMDFELFLPALRPLLLTSGLSQTNVDSLIANAQHDLYHPVFNLSARIHVVHGNKPLSRT